MKLIRRVLGIALLVIAIPLAVPGLLLLGIVFVLPLAVTLWMCLFVGEVRFTLKMIFKERYVPWYVLGEIRQGDRLILESPTMGHGITRLWLIPTELMVECPFRPPRSEDEVKEFANELDPFPVHPYDEWVYRRGMSPESGVGFLIQAWDGHRCCDYLARRQRNLETSHIWSAPVLMKLERMHNP